MRGMRWVAFVVAVLSMCVVACSGPGVGNRSSSDGPRLILATADAVEAAIEEPGAEVVLVNFWASWCKPCLDEFPAMLRVVERYQDRGVRLILISVDDEYDAAHNFLKMQGVTFPTYFMNEDAHRFIMKIPWRGSLPSTIVYNADGPQVTFEGAATEAMFEALIEEVLALQ